MARNRTLGQRRRYQILVVGLGRFGTSVATALMDLGHEVLAVDTDERIVQRYAGSLTKVVEADATTVDALRDIGADEFERAVVAIGTDVEASVLTTAALADLRVPNIWAKAITAAHGKILERVGAHHVVFPEHDMGLKVAHLVTGQMIEYVELDTGFAIVQTRAPAALVGKTLAEAGLRGKYGVTVMCVKPVDGSFTYATADTVIGADDLLIVAGEPANAEAFAELT